MLTQKRSVVVIVILLASLVLAACRSEATEPQPTAANAVLPAPEINVVDTLSAPTDVVESDLAANAGQNIQNGPPNVQAVTEAGNGPGPGNHTLLAGSTTDLSQDEEEAILYMREEEKLARDVYLYLYEQWGQPLFQNIAASEQAHMDSILVLLDTYGLADPAVAEAGVFNNADLQALYDQLVEQGSLSLADALRAGALIEEVDILDLQDRLAATTNAQIIQVFNNLLGGSGNHLRAFVTNLERLIGESYTPQLMSLEDYQAIISGSLQPGGNGFGGAGSGGTGSGGAGGSGAASGGGNGGRGYRGGNGGGQGQAAS